MVARWNRAVALNGRFITRRQVLQASAIDPLKITEQMQSALMMDITSTRTASGGTGEPRGAGGGGQSGQRAFFTRPPFVGGDGQGG